MPDSESETPTPKLSKSALKKAARAERYAASRLERRAKEKELRKEKKRIRAEKRGAGELDDEDEQHGRQKKKLKLEFGGRVVIDLGFDDKMTDKEIASLCSQLAYTYSANRNASYPFSLLHTSLNGRTLARLESMNDSGYRRWTETEWWTEGYEYLWTGQAGPISPKNQCNAPAMAAQNAVVYLTADSEEELLHLSPDETYIIGGLCDHNRYKNLCLNKANKSGIRTARLPIGRYLASLPTRKVLTVNQVFEIMVKWVETRSWEEALYSVVPKRKFQAGKSNDKDATTENLVMEVMQEEVADERFDEGRATEPLAG